MVQYPNGDIIQYFTTEFNSNNWKGQLKMRDNTEIKKASFRDRTYLNELPLNEKSTFISLEYYREKQQIKLK